MPNGILLFVGGLVLGGIAAWLALGRKSSEAENKAAGLESSARELRLQVQQRETQAVQLQAELTKQQAGRVTAETRLTAIQANLDEQKTLLSEATARLTDTFNALSAEALKSNNQMFLDLAKKTLENLITEAKGDLGKHQKEIDGIVKPLQDTLKRYEDQLREMENIRHKDHGTLTRHLDDLQKAQDSLQKETVALVMALKAPQVRGRWGEITLRRVVEMAGMSQYCDFEEQPSTDTEEGRKRPDLIVKLPAGRTVVVDAKVPLKAYMEALEAQDETARKTALLRHAEAVRKYMKDLGSKSYWSQFNPSPDFVILFLPGESFFSAALEQDRQLIEDGIAGGVVLATPTTLITLLKTVAYTWQQQDISENAQRIWETGRELFERITRFAEHLDGIRKGLDDAGSAYNAALGSWESRLLPGLKKLKELGATSGPKEVPELEPVDTALRKLTEKTAGGKR